MTPSIMNYNAVGKYLKWSDCSTDINKTISEDKTIERFLNYIRTNKNVSAKLRCSVGSLTLICNET